MVFRHRRHCCRVRVGADSQPQDGWLAFVGGFGAGSEMSVTAGARSAYCRFGARLS